MHRSESRSFAALRWAAALVFAGLGLAGCRDNTAPSVTTAPDTSAEVSHPATSPPAPGDTTLGPSSEVLRFEASGDIACVPETTSVEVTYATRGLDAVGFVVDGQGVQTGVASPTSGTFAVPVPCDGNVHTIMLIGSGPGGPAFATKAVVTRPT